MNVIIFLLFVAVFIYLLFRLAEGRNQTKQRGSTAHSRRSTPRRAGSRRSRSRRTAARQSAARYDLSDQIHSYPPTQATQHSAQSSKAAAARAMQRAQYDVGEEFVRITDIGLLEYRGADRPRLLRTEQARIDSDYLRPFAELWLPYRSRGMVRFELAEMVNGRPRLHYADEDEYDLQAGVNALLPSTWLPLQNKAIDGSDRWHLRILVGETMLADHEFRWRDAIASSEIQRYIASDGEISAALQQAIAAQQDEAISLDDLLGG